MISHPGGRSVSSILFQHRMQIPQKGWLASDSLPSAAPDLSDEIEISNDKRPCHPGLSWQDAPEPLGRNSDSLIFRPLCTGIKNHAYLLTPSLLKPRASLLGILQVLATCLGLLRSRMWLEQYPGEHRVRRLQVTLCKMVPTLLSIGSQLCQQHRWPMWLHQVVSLPSYQCLTHWSLLMPCLIVWLTDLLHSTLFTAFPLILIPPLVAKYVPNLQMSK